MNKKELSDRFSRDVDKLLGEMGVINNDPVSTEYDDMLQLAREIATADFSHQSRIRFSLRRRLLAKVKDASVAEVEIPGPVGLLKNIFTRRSRPSALSAGLAGKGRLALIGVAGLLAASLVILFIASPLGRQIGPRLAGLLVELLPPEPPTIINSAPPVQMSSLWQFRGEGGISSPPLVANNQLFVGDNAGNLYAIDLQTGSERWRFRAGGSIEAAPLIGGNAIYVPTNKGHLYALNSATGQQQWSFAAGAAIWVAPALANNMVYVGSEDTHIYALDATTGQELWRFKTGSAIASSPVMAENRLYLGSRDWHVYALDATTGRELWRFKTGDWVISSPLVLDGLLYVGSMDENLYALDAETGQEKWRFFAGDDVVSSPAYADGMIYVGSFDSHLYAVDARSGQERWRFKTGRVVQATPLVLNGLVYIGSGDGNLYAVDAHTGQLRGQFETDSQIYASPAAVPAFDTEKQALYFVTGKGTLYAVQSAAQEFGDKPNPSGFDSPGGPAGFQFTPSGWYASNPDNVVRFRGRIVDEQGNPVNGVTVQADNGKSKILSSPSGSMTGDGEWEILISGANLRGWWWLTVVGDECPAVVAEGDPPCQEFIRLSESVKAEIVFPAETTINADWVCHYACWEFEQNDK